MYIELLIAMPCDTEFAITYERKGAGGASLSKWRPLSPEVLKVDLSAHLHIWGMRGKKRQTTRLSRWQKPFAIVWSNRYHSEVLMLVEFSGYVVDVDPLRLV